MKSICQKKYHKNSYNYEYKTNSIFSLKSKFDLVIVNNVLSAIPKSEIRLIINHLCVIGKFLYIRENDLTDGISWFNHDILEILDSRKVLIRNKGYILYKNE